MKIYNSRQTKSDGLASFCIAHIRDFQGIFEVMHFITMNYKEHLLQIYCSQFNTY